MAFLLTEETARTASTTATEGGEIAAVSPRSRIIPLSGRESSVALAFTNGYPILFSKISRVKGSSPSASPH